VSVKTRIGLNKIITEDWAGFLLTQNLAALTIHGRTVREMSKVPARWNEIAKVATLRNQLAPDTVVIGNGDARDHAHGLQLAAETGVDGIMIGRGVFHDIYTFDPNPTEHTPQEMITILLKHLDLYEQWGSNKPFQILKKFFKIYVNSWPGASDLRVQLMEATTPDEVRSLLTNTHLPTFYTTDPAPLSASVQISR
ncbi:MAG TPA: tRNA-dihydrouridine synthase, partial [Candidatus Saccharimonadia bacterium]|nr:tRNA-dihydrouridine synthase [Candidatus Saccharimonadia bacterium]